MEEANEEKTYVGGSLQVGTAGGNLGLLESVNMSWKTDADGNDVYMTSFTTEDGYGPDGLDKDEKVLQVFGNARLGELFKTDLERYEPKSPEEPKELEPSSNLWINLYRTFKNVAGEPHENTISGMVHPRDFVAQLEKNDPSNTILGEEGFNRLKESVSEFESGVVMAKNNNLIVGAVSPNETLPKAFEDKTIFDLMK